MQAASRVTHELLCSDRSAPCVGILLENVRNGLAYVLRLVKKNKIPAAKIAAVNVSAELGAYSGPCDADYPMLAPIITTLGKKYGIAVIAATGNDKSDDKIGAPACISSAIAVGASTKKIGEDNKEYVWSKSNHTPLVKLLAPDLAIKAADSSGPKATGTSSGTSLAAPHVSGAFALLRDAKPKATVGEILAALECTGKPLKRQSGSDLKKPRIDLLKALRHIKRSSDEPERWDFDKPGNAKDWKQLSGKWEIKNGHWEVRRSSDYNNITWHPNCDEALEVTASMQNINKTKWGTYGGLLIKATIDEATKRVSGYRFEYSYSGLETEERHRDGVLVRRYDNIYLLESSGYKTLCNKEYAYGSVVNINGRNRVRVISRGGKHRFFLNDKLV